MLLSPLSPREDHQAKLARATLHQERGELATAARLCREVLATNPLHAEALHMAGVLAAMQGDAAEAATLLGRAVQAQPTDARAHMNLGNALLDLRRPADALAAFDRAVALDRSKASVFYNRGVALADLRRHAEALESYTRAVALDPDHVEAHFGIGNMQTVLRRPAAALAAYDRALARAPRRADLWVQRANRLQELGRFAEAIVGYARAHTLAPHDPAAPFAAALCHLMLGEYERGWRLYEWRLRRDDMRPTLRLFAEPLWHCHEPAADRTVLLHAEQGFGDTIQFCRYADVVADLGWNVVLEVQPELVTVMRSLAGAHTVVARGEALPPFDAQMPLLGLPLAFGTTVATIPAHTPYLRAEPARAERWTQILGPRTRSRIGVAWSVGGTEPGDPRAIPLGQFAALCTGGADYVSLHKDIGDDDRATLAGLQIRTVDDEIADFADTAALIAALDLVITVDTAVAHLAGALGRPVWLLVSRPNASFMWRWLLRRDDSPWYPTARLFRQGDDGEWGAAIAAARAALDAWLR